MSNTSYNPDDEEVIVIKSRPIMIGFTGPIQTGQAITCAISSSVGLGPRLQVSFLSVASDLSTSIFSVPVDGGGLFTKTVVVPPRVGWPPTGQIVAFIRDPDNDLAGISAYRDVPSMRLSEEAVDVKEAETSVLAPDESITSVPIMIGITTGPITAGQAFTFKLHRSDNSPLGNSLRVYYTSYPDSGFFAFNQLQPVTLIGNPITADVTHYPDTMPPGWPYAGQIAITVKDGNGGAGSILTDVLP